MNIIIVSIHVAAAVILVLTVLLQAGKGAGMGAAFGGSSGTVFGTRGPATLISKITCAAAIIFMCTSLNLAISQGGLNKGSIMDEYSSEVGASAAPVSAPAEFAATPAPVTDEASAPVAEGDPAEGDLVEDNPAEGSAAETPAVSEPAPAAAE